MLSEETGEDVLLADVEADQGPGADAVFLPNDDGDQYARRIVVNQGAASFVPGPFTGDHREERTWLLQIQQTGEAAIRGAVKVAVRYGIGGVTFAKTFTLPAPPSEAAANNGPSPPYPVLIYGRHVDVSFASAQTAILNAAISPAPFEQRNDFYAWQWVTYNGDSFEGQIVTGSGVLRNARAVAQVLAGAAGTPFWPMLFDSVGAPAGGSLPLLLLPALRQLGDDVSFEDSSPGTLQFQLGLYVALSSTPDTFTSAAAGEIVVNAMVGQ